MKRFAILAGAAAVIGLGVWIRAQVASTARPLATVFPGGPLLYMEVRDFGRLLREWNTSSEKRQWLASDNYAVFSRSRLFERLAMEQQAFAGAAGFTADMSLLDTMAGAESALAVYDIGELAFLYVTRAPASKIAGTVLANVQSSYESRTVANQTYFVRRSGGKTAAFASVDGLLLLATREDLMASALSFLGNQATTKPVSEDPWYARAKAAAAGEGEIRLALNISPLLASPYFRSYWIQRNRSGLAPYDAAVIDLFRETNRFREERVLLRVEQGSATPGQAAAGQLLALAPPTSGLHRVWASPPVDLALSLVAEKILSPGTPSRRSQSIAPGAVNVTSVAGTEADLETAIDQPPLPTETSNEPAVLRSIVEATGLDAALQVQTSTTYPDGVFIGNESAVVLLAASPWPEAAVRNALPGRFIRVAGRHLILSDRPELLNSVAARLQQPAMPAVSYAAFYRHQQEFEPFVQMMRMIDAARPRPVYGDSGTRQPNFFSDNVASLGALFPKLDAESIRAIDTGTQRKEQMVYTFLP